MKRLLDRELTRWLLPALAALVVFVLYASIASIVLVTSGGPEAMAAAAEETLGAADDIDDEDSDPSAESEDDPSSEPVVPATDPRLPATCDELFSPGVVSGINQAGLVLEPGWAQGQSIANLGIQDGELAAIAAGSPYLECRWLRADGSTGSGIRTLVVAVDDAQIGRINQRLSALGYTPQNELGGTRFFFESTSGGTAFGESHIAHSGVWFATHWLGYGPRGYTADMVTNYFN